DYIFGTSITYEISVTNRGRSAFALPWSADRALIENDSQPYTQLQLALTVFDRQGGEHLLSAVILSGAPRVPRSIQMLAPNETARIRARGNLRVSPEEAGRIASEGQAAVRAALTVTVNSHGPSDMERVLSANGLLARFRLARVP